MKWTLLLVLMALLAGAFVARAESSEIALADAETEADEMAVDVEDEAEEEVEAEDEAEAEDEDELEVEEEEEESDEVEDEEADEDEAEDEAEEEMEAVESVQLETESEFEAALGENAQGKWHVYSEALTQKAHEGISQAAFEKLERTAKDLLNVEKLKQGAIWNDMPSGVETEEAAMIKDGHMDVDTWSRLFFFTGGIDDLVFNVHYGCMQHFHSMAPIQRTEAKANPSTRIVFTNDQVKAFIKAQLIAWFDLAMQTPQDKDRAAWYLGHILHAVQDSYPRGHVVRAATATECGDIVLFQGYDAQHGNAAHKAGDYSPTHKNKENSPTLQTRYNCAVDQSANILRVATGCMVRGGCTGATALGPILDIVYRLAPGAATRIAGGSQMEFAKAGAAADTTNFVTEVVGPFTLYNLKSNTVWGSANTRGRTLCGGTKPVQSKAPTGRGGYAEKPFHGFVEFTA